MLTLISLLKSLSASAKFTRFAVVYITSRPVGPCSFKWHGLKFSLVNDRYSNMPLAQISSPRNLSLIVSRISTVTMIGHLSTRKKFLEI
jgi:hypothetical protein